MVKYNLKVKLHLIVMIKNIISIKTHFMAISSFHSQLGTHHLQSIYLRVLRGINVDICSGLNLFTLLFSSGVTAIPTAAPTEKPNNSPADFSSLKAANPWNTGIFWTLCDRVKRKSLHFASIQCHTRHYHVDLSIIAAITQSMKVPLSDHFFCCWS